MIKAVLIDDESLAIRALQALLEEYFDFVEVAGTAGSIEEGKRLILKQSPDLVFLDVELRDGTGFDLLASIPVNFKIIFVTACSTHALKAIKHRVFDYLLKPVTVDELAKTLDDVKRELQKQPVAYVSMVSIPCSRGSLYVHSDQVVRLEANGSYSKIYLECGASHLVSHNLSYYEKLLDPRQFFRCHHSHIINLGMVRRMVQEMGTAVILNDGSYIDVSKRKRAELSQRMAAVPI